MSCTHTNSAKLQNFNPNTQKLECPDCVAQGDSNWVELRICTTCGHVGCCDSSPNTHSTKHFKETNHPTIQSFQPNQTWLWCFIDEEKDEPGKKLYSSSQK